VFPKPGWTEAAVKNHAVIAKKAFTLIELLVVIVIVGVILSAAIAPMVLTIRNLRTTESDFGTAEAVWKSTEFVGRDIRQSCPTYSGPAFRLLEDDRGGGPSGDMLCFMASAEPALGTIPGAVLYRIIRDGKNLPGLYRISYPAMEPGEVDCKKIPRKRIQLILPYVESFKVSVWDGKTWAEKYRGPRPGGVKLTLSRDGEVVEYVDWIPK